MRGKFHELSICIALSSIFVADGAVGLFVLSWLSYGVEKAIYYLERYSTLLILLVPILALYLYKIFLPRLKALLTEKDCRNMLCTSKRTNLKVKFFAWIIFYLLFISAIYFVAVMYNIFYGEQVSFSPITVVVTPIPLLIGFYCADRLLAKYKTNLCLDMYPLLQRLIDK